MALIICLAASVLWPKSSFAQYEYTTNADGITATLTGYHGSGGDVILPTNINGLTVVNIAEGAFENDRVITNLTISSTITNVGVNSLGSSSLTSVTFQAGADCIIDDFAFTLCGRLTNVSISASVTNIEFSAFSPCSSLRAINVASDNEYYSSMDGVLFDKAQTTLIKYPEGIPGNYTIPTSVTVIGEDAFVGMALTNLVVPASLTNIEVIAFYDTWNLEGIFFLGEPPFAAHDAFEPASPYLKFYYLPGTTGWDTFAAEQGLPAVLWNPQIQTTNANCGVMSNQFGFDITGTTNIPITVEASTNLSSPNWLPLQSLTLINGLVHFADPQWTNSLARYYRISPP